MNAETIWLAGRLLEALWELPVLWPLALTAVGVGVAYLVNRRRDR